MMIISDGRSGRDVIGPERPDYGIGALYGCFQILAIVLNFLGWNRPCIIIHMRYNKKHRLLVRSVKTCSNSVNKTSNCLVRLYG
jgi:hypothetical protein